MNQQLTDLVRELVEQEGMSEEQARAQANRLIGTLAPYAREYDRRADSQRRAAAIIRNLRRKRNA